MLSREQLIAFEQRVADAFSAKRIRAPVHLCSSTQAEPLIDIFKHIKPTDWVFATWRSHFAALLKGVPEDWLFNEILAGRSMFVMNREHRILCSAIVGGALPIAAGVALGIKLKGGSERVYCFVGDMCARTGIFHEFSQYCRGHSLPVSIVIEDNQLSTNANTADTWGRSIRPLSIQRYNYTRTFPHVGLQTRVSF